MFFNVFQKLKNAFGKKKRIINNKEKREKKKFTSSAVIPRSVI